MLSLVRRLGERVTIRDECGREVFVQVAAADCSDPLDPTFRVGFEGPRSLDIFRSELADRPGRFNKNSNGGPARQAFLVELLDDEIVVRDRRYPNGRRFESFAAAEAYMDSMEN